MENEEELSEKIISVYELNKINEELEDPEVTKVLVKITQIIADPNKSLKNAQVMIPGLEALAFSFNLKSKYYMLVGKGEPKASLKKNLYASLAKSTSDLVAAIKYVLK